MNTLLLTLALLAWTPPPQLEQEVLRQGQEIQQLQSAIEAQQRETRELRAALEQQQPPCVAELEALNPNTVFDASESDILRLEVLGTVSRPANRCLPASVWITGTYIDTDGQLICTGTVRDVARQEALTGSIGLEVRPFGLVNFVRWANQPQRTASGALRLPCVSPDGVIEVTVLPAARVAALRLRVSLFPGNGGLATTDFLLNLR